MARNILNHFARGILVLLLGAFSACFAGAQSPAISTFEECVSAGNKVLRTFPARCVTADGLTFVEAATMPVEVPLKTPAIQKALCVDMCGNGECEQIVCMGTGCPCAESHQSCPKDCAQ